MDDQIYEDQVRLPKLTITKNTKVKKIVEAKPEVEEPDETVDSKEKPEKKEPLWKQTLDTVIYLLVLMAICILFVKFVAVRTVVYGSSMYPTLNNKDNLIVEKVSYYFHGPKRFDVIVFDPKDAEEKNYIKRVIGLPGETVQIIDGYVYIDGELLEEDTYGYEVMDFAYTAEDPILLGEDEYFVLGDNRNNSTDSRAAKVGPVNKKLILGHAAFRIFPLNKMGVVKGAKK